MPRRTSIAALLAAAILFASHPSAAFDPEELYQSALTDMKAQNYAAACPKFADARRLKPDSTPALQGLALCYDRLGKTASAWSKYRELGVEFKSHGDARAQAALDRAQELSLILSTVTIKVAAPDTPGLIIRLDGDEVPRGMFGNKVNVDPGSHVVEATAPGYGVWQTKITSGERSDAQSVQIPALDRLPAGAAPPPAATGTGPTPAPQPPAASPQAPVPYWGTQRTAGAAIAGVGVAAAIVGGIFGGLTLAKKNGLTADCQVGTPYVCNQAGVDLRGQAITMANVSNAAFAVAGAALVTGAAVFFTAPKPEAQRTGLSLGVSVGAAGQAGDARLLGRW